MSRKRIVCFDGGGQLGLAEARYYQLMKEAIGPVDMYAGTSTGGMIAAALSFGIPIGDIIQFYKDWGPRIFKKRFGYRYARLLFTNRYSAKALHEGLREVFGDAHLSDLKTPVLIPSIDYLSRQLFFFHENKNYSIYDACRATSAAPTYFPAYQAQGHVWIDGGLVSNNPAEDAYFAARKLWGDVPLEIISIGFPKGSLSHRKKFPKYTLMMIDDLVSVPMAVSQNRPNKTLPGLPGVTYKRIELSISEPLRMDDTSEHSINVLLDAGERRARIDGEFNER
jgi:patatin-like phospholipase/acyl hydrolase